MRDGKIRGEWYGGSSTGAFPIRFSTKYTDLETTTTSITIPGTGGGSTTVNVSASLVYFGYRFYNPDTARWLTRDPIEESGGLNLYEYAGNNPVSRIDPLGQFPKWIIPIGPPTSAQIIAFLSALFLTHESMPPTHLYETGVSECPCNQKRYAKTVVFEEGYVNIRVKWWLVVDIPLLTGGTEEITDYSYRRQTSDYACCPKDEYVMRTSFSSVTTPAPPGPAGVTGSGTGLGGIVGFDYTTYGPFTRTVKSTYACGAQIGPAE